MEALSDSGISVTPIRNRYRPLFLIETASNAEAQIAWSYVEAEKCLIKSRPAYPREDRETTYPTGYIYRPRHDDDRRMMFGVGLPMLLLPFLLSLPILIFRAIGAPLPESQLTEFLLGSATIGVLMEFLYVLWLFSGKEFGMGGLLWRFVLAVAFGLAWTIIPGQSWSAVGLLAAAWTFSGANLVWGMTAGYEHWRLDYEFEHVGGRLIRRVAVERLNDLRGALKGDPKR